MQIPLIDLRAQYQAIKYEDEVIIAANPFIATVEAIALVDLNANTMAWRQLDQVRAPRTRALFPIHFYSHPAEMQPVLELERAHGLRVIEYAPPGTWCHLPWAASWKF